MARPQSDHIDVVNVTVHFSVGGRTKCLPMTSSAIQDAWTASPNWSQWHLHCHFGVIICDEEMDWVGNVSGWSVAASGQCFCAQLFAWLPLLGWGNRTGWISILDWVKRLGFCFERRMTPIRRIFHLDLAPIFVTDISQIGVVWCFGKLRILGSCRLLGGTKCARERYDSITINNSTRSNALNQRHER